jgi:2-octaprenylphenol hydroxylase
MNAKIDNLDVDVVIVGAGLAGATLAAALGGSPLRIAVVDRDPLPEWPSGAFDLRVSAINVASARILDHIGAWQHISPVRRQPFYAMQVWDSGGTGSTRFDAADIGETCFGHITENRLTVRALIESCSQFDNISLLFEQALAAINIEPHQCSVSLQSGRHITARLIVGADGGRSQVRKLAGITMPMHAYRQRTIVASVATAEHHAYTAWQRFLPTGPCAYLPLANGDCSLAWHADDDTAQMLLSLDDAAFEDQLQRASDDCLGRPALRSKRASFPLFRGHAECYFGPRVALVGDAAHVVHPLAGLGANLGISDAACLAELLLNSKRRDPGAVSTLQRYQRWRHGENAAVVTMTDAFYRVFRRQEGAAKGLRNLGLALADHSGPVKSQIMRLAAGISGDPPKLAQIG